MGKIRLYAVILGVALLVTVPGIFATTLRVPAEYPTIQTAIDSAAVGDTVLLTDGIYRGEGNRDIVFHGRDVTVTSVSGPKTCIIDCEGTNEDRHCGFYIGGGEQDADIVLSGLTIMNGYEDTGGALEIFSASPEITNCVFYNNHANALGGAIMIYSAGIDTLANCLFVGNTSQDGGGIFVSRCSPLIYQCTFIDNVGRGQIVTEDLAYPHIDYCLFVGGTIFSQPECCPGYPVVGPSGNTPLNCINLNHGYLTDLWDVDSTTYFDIDPKICYQDSVSYKVDSTSPCLPQNNQFNTRIGSDAEICVVTDINDDDMLSLPMSPALYQNYPNPFNPATSISFDLPTKAHVTIEIINALGQTIRIVADQTLPAGEHRVLWDGRTENSAIAGSGVYFYRLTADNFVLSKKMLLLK